jgi:FAD/FMN-containing dehydrogenase
MLLPCSFGLILTTTLILPSLRLCFDIIGDDTMAADGTTRGAPAAAGVGCAGGNLLQDIPWIETSSSEYESKRKTYNLDNPATPYAIASPRNARDVAALVRYSIDSGIPFTVRSGGHDLFGRSVAQSALCIDMRAIDFVEIAPDKKSARVGGGILFGKLIQELTLENLTTPFAAVPSIGYVGWASLGGYGGVSGQWGLGVDQIIGAEIVDAYGNIVQADEETLKGIKGAGGNFGVVVALRIKLYELKTVGLNLEIRVLDPFLHFCLAY